MKYVLMLITVLMLLSCQSPNNGKPSTTLGDEKAATNSGINGVYYGGDSYNPGGTGGANAATQGNFYDNPNYGQSVVGGPQAPAKDRVIYFSYDSSTIYQRALAIVRAHANYLKKHPQAKILLEGHTDSRGSREYNIALGERRAVSVLRQFANMGVVSTNMRIVSYGEENPAVNGFDENAYKRNRRVVIQY